MTIKKIQVVLLCTWFSTLSGAFAAPVASHPLEQETGLKRFDKNAVLDQDSQSRSQQDIKGVHLGDNVLAQAISLYDQGAKLHHIPGSSRSDKVKLSFYQPYENSRVVQRLELHFNKFSGFINRIDSIYKIESAYLAIEPILTDVLQSAVIKYGEPLHMDQIKQIAGTRKPPVSLRTFISKLHPPVELAELVKDYFARQNISRSAGFISGDGDRAILKSGFNRCYVWQLDDFTEILTLCSFAPNAANASNRGVELSLVNFAVQQKIADKQQLKNELSLSL